MKIVIRGFIVVLIIYSLVLAFSLFYSYGSLYTEYKGAEKLVDKVIDDNIIKNNEEGLNYINNEYIFKGSITNNYVLYNNILWQIVKINNDKTMTLISADYLNVLSYNFKDEFTKVVEANLDTKNLVKNTICTDATSSLENITCNTKTKDSYVNYLSIYDYVNSIYNNETYITNNEKELIWLNDLKEENIAWHTNGLYLSDSKTDNFYEVKIIITLAKSLEYESGNGTKDEPYLISNSSLSLGSTVKLDNTLYTVYDITSSIKLVSNDSLNNLLTSDVSNYLNETLYNNLSYKSLLEEENWKETIITGEEVKDGSNKTYVAIPGLLDIKFNNTEANYYLLAKVNNYQLIYSSPIIYGSKNKVHNTKYTISIDKKYLNNFKLDNGVYIYEGN